MKKKVFKEEVSQFLFVGNRNLRFRLLSREIN